MSPKAPASKSPSHKSPPKKASSKASSGKASSGNASSSKEKEPPTKKPIVELPKVHSAPPAKNPAKISCDRSEPPTNRSPTKRSCLGAHCTHTAHVCRVPGCVKIRIGLRSGPCTEGGFTTAHEARDGKKGCSGQTAAGHEVAYDPYRYSVRTAC